ncbi:hypothetical protein, partial [Pseudomonas marginalis]|uniref:hypothetical protein n=1 Tax=Pseudomonas marginalis TaxID=298 RepID=UPI0034D3FD2A
PRLDRYDDPDPIIQDNPEIGEQPEINLPRADDPVVERLIENLDLTEEDKSLLRYYCQIRDELEDYKSFKSEYEANKQT